MLCSYSVMLQVQFLPTVSEERVFTVPSCYLFVCKVGKLPFKSLASFWCPSLHLLFKGQGEQRREENGGREQYVTSHWNGTSPSVLLCTPQPLDSLVHRQWPNSHCRGSIFQFPDLVGCILLCKHSPLRLWNPKQHLYLHLNGERQNSPEISPQVAFVCFWLLRTRTGAGWAQNLKL